MKQVIPVLALIAVSAGAATAQPVQVVGQGNAPQRVIYFGDLDLAKADGVETLKGRVNKAARNMCKSYSDIAAQTQANNARCFRTALDDGYSQADALHRAHLGGSPIVTASLVISAR